MVIKREVYLDGPNLSLVNVLIYVEKRIKDGEKTFSYTLENGAVYTLILRNPSGSSHSLSVDFTYTIEPRDKKKPLQVYNLVGMRFSGIQLFADRVMITGECDNESDFIKKRFNEVWDAMLKAFATESPKRPKNMIADNLGGTITYTRNEQGQVIPTGGAINPGYYAEIGQGVSIMPERQIRFDHTTGSIKPGSYSAEEKDGIIRVTSETSSDSMENSNSQVANKEKKSKERNLGEALADYKRKIERGEPVEDTGGIVEYLYKTGKYINDLGGGDWKIGMTRYKELENKRLLSMFVREPTPEEKEQFLKDNPEFAVYMELMESENPLQMLQSENPAHRTLMKLLLEGAHVNLSTGNANKRAAEIRREEFYKTAMQFPALNTQAVQASPQKQPRCPKQGSKRFITWQATWRKIKGRVQHGDNYQELAKSLEGTNLSASPELIADIVKAGHTGLLD